MEESAKTKQDVALVAELHPAYHVKGGTANLIKTFCSYSSHPFCSVVAADLAGPDPVPGPWDSIPTLSLLRPRSLFPNLRLGLGQLDNIAFRLQKQRVIRFLKKHNVQRLFVLIANNARFASFAANLPRWIPRDVYIVDDFVADSHLYRVNKEKAQKVLDRLVTESDRVFTISPVYAAGLEAQYRRPCQFLPIPIAGSLLNTIEATTTKKINSGENQDIIIHHSGQIHHLYIDALINLIDLLKKIANIKKKTITLELWGNITEKDVENSLKIDLRTLEKDSAFKIKLCGEVSPAELALEQKRADFLLLVNSFLPELEKQIRCSFSSKICEYMVSGVPILVYAPPYSSLTAHLGKHRAAYIVDTKEPEEAQKKMEKIISDPDKDRVVEAAGTLAMDLHSSKAFFDTIASGGSEPF